MTTGSRSLGVQNVSVVNLSQNKRKHVYFMGNTNNSKTMRPYWESQRLLTMQGREAGNDSIESCEAFEPDLFLCITYRYVIITIGSSTIEVIIIAYSLFT